MKPLTEEQRHACECASNYLSNLSTIDIYNSYSMDLLQVMFAQVWTVMKFNEIFGKDYDLPELEINEELVNAIFTNNEDDIYEIMADVWFELSYSFHESLENILAYSGWQCDTDVVYEIIECAEEGLFFGSWNEYFTAMKEEEYDDGYGTVKFSNKDIFTFYKKLEQYSFLLPPELVNTMKEKKPSWFLHYDNGADICYHDGEFKIFYVLFAEGDDVEIGFEQFALYKLFDCILAADQMQRWQDEYPFLSDRKLLTCA